MAQEIPLDCSPNQTFDCTVTVGDSNKTFIFTLRYNPFFEGWIMTITDPVTKEILLDSIPFVTGDYPAANMLEPHKYLDIGSAYIVNVSKRQDINFPDDESLGSDFVLLWDDTPED